MPNNNILSQKHHLLTAKQLIKKNKIIAIIIISSVSLFVIAWTIILSLESSRVSHVHYDTLAEERITNNGRTAAKLFDSYLQFCFQELDSYKDALDKIDNESLSDEAEIIAYTNKKSIDTYVDNIGILYDGKAYFQNDIEVSFPAGFQTVETYYFYDGKAITNTEKDYLYFVVPPCEKHNNTQGIVGRISKAKITKPIAPETHKDEEANLSNDSIILVNKNYEIILFSSPNHEWRFVDESTNETYVSYSKAMSVWVNDKDYAKYEEFIADPTMEVLNVGENDRDAMIYKHIFAGGDYIILFMAPKAMLTKTIIDSSTATLIILYVALVLLLFVTISGVIIIFRQRKLFIVANSYSKLTNLDKEDTFYSDATTIIFANTNKEFALIHMNIKEFGKINEVYGTEFAESLLVAIGKNIYELMESEFEVACYKNGGHFLLLLEGNKDDIMFKVTSLHDNLQQIEGFKNIKLRLTFGINFLNTKYPSLHKEMEKAQFAERTLKNTTDFLAVYDTEMDNIQKDLEELTTRFDNAIDNGEFEIYLQLKWDLRNNDWAGAETLVRWNHPKKGLLSPGRFIPLFEENGYITKLDVYVFEKSCQLIREMLDANERVVPLSINLSKKHFSNLSFMDTYEAIVQKYEIPHNLVEFEITEGLLMDNVDVFTRFIKVFHDNEYYIAMDDFGAGYSSLNMIHELDFDVIKIDAKFFRAGLDKANKTIIQSIINLCHKLNKTVVAEGIENEHEVKFLKEVGCDIIQGYYFAKPVPAEEFKVKLNKTEEQ